MDAPRLREVDLESVIIVNKRDIIVTIVRRFLKRIEIFIERAEELVGTMQTRINPEIIQRCRRSAMVNRGRVIRIMARPTFRRHLNPKQG